ncbi:inositol-3-phosphate synthase [Novosphingobium tardum]|uniref:Inositol-3-phosphate synthase n=1 Tax=Novosphingobium tardum TaxID=1538021 RepID=A0ABV8RK96_9SPHN
MQPIKTAIIGVGNCASSLVQGTAYYRESNTSAGLIHDVIGGYGAGDVDWVLGVDVDARKVGKDISEAIFAAPNCTKVFQKDVPPTGNKVIMGKVLDGVAGHMTDHGDLGFIVADEPEATRESMVAALKASGAEVMLNFLPVGSQEATEFYMECALEAGVAVVNCMPVFIASRPEWEARFRKARLPIVGDDVKAQLGATIVHRVLSSLFGARGVNVDRTYQLNTGGNTDFMNMLDRQRLGSKKTSKTEAVQAMLAQRLADENIHVGPSDYVPWQKDNKLCFLRMEGELFGGVPMNLELRLSVEDSPNSAAVVIDAIRCCKLALDRGEGGALAGPSAYFCKHPPVQYNDDLAAQMVNEFIADTAIAAE